MGHALEFLLTDKHDIRIWSIFTQNILEDEVSQADIILLCLPVNAHVRFCTGLQAVSGQTAYASA